MMVDELAAHAEIIFEPKLPTQHVIELSLLHECTPRFDNLYSDTAVHECLYDERYLSSARNLAHAARTTAP